MSLRRLFPALVACVLPLTASSPALAQDLGRCQTSKQMKIDRQGPDRITLIGQVEIHCGQESFYADTVELLLDVDQLIATGNVVFTSGTSRIAADRVEFNTRTKTGTFFNASGTARIGGDRSSAEVTRMPHMRPPGSVQPLMGDEEEFQPDRSMFGTQESDVFFYGETVAKLGPKKYRITKGGFSTCVQPVPRWELTSSSVTVTLDDYALLKNSFMKVKGVPVFYLPLMYYPVQEDDRATGFLLPSYGTSTLRGQGISNAFFWAISRSQDATFMHDWFSKAGQGYGAEYRYTRGGGSDGIIRTYLLRENGSEFTDTDGTVTTTPARRSHEIQGSMSQRLGSNIRARARADYFSDITVQQTYHQNLYEATRRQRVFSGSITGTWSQYTVTGTFDRSEYFRSATSSDLRGSAPRIQVSRAERPLLGSPVYFRVTADYNRLQVERRTEERIVDQGLSRLDVLPRIRVPFTRWPFLTINTSAGFRTTYWSESRDETGTQVPVGISRNYYDVEAQITGPVFNRIWTFPGNRYAEKLKHSIEPFLTADRVSAIDHLDRIVRLDSVDTVIGNTTRLNYGITNRLYRKPPAGGTSREILNVSIGQTYYSDERAARVDRRYRTGVGGAESNFSPLAINVRAWPTDRISANYSAEYDTRFKAFRYMSADGSIQWSDWLQATAGWSQRRFIEGLPGYDDPEFLDHYLNATTQVRFMGNRWGGSHSFNYDVREGLFLQQRVMVYYNAQ
ncbi:MAG TPA: putative LPS assembly protein LptD, partial [Vicinamibacterales bacterium]|nr:putative LPS assembly protein LptD [Vicinamibacterales bacterium]